MTDRIQPIESLGGQQPGQKPEPELTQAQADYKQGRELFAKGEYGQAGMAYHNALRSFEEEGNEQGVANCSDRLGDVCVAREEYRMALDHFQRAYDICEKEQDIFSMASLKRKQAGIHKRMGEYTKALGLLFDLFDHYSQLRDPKGTLEILEVISEAYLETGENAKAADALRTIAGIHANFRHARLAREFEERALAAEQG